MFRGFYTAASGMLTQMQREQMLTNNLANVNTPGYKADRAVERAFPQMLIERIHDGKPPAESKVGGLATGVYVQETVPKFVEGGLKETGSSTDVALLQGNVPDADGTLFFAVQNAKGQVRYTRDGNFTVDAKGRIVDNAGDFVLGMNGNPITVADPQFQVRNDGTVVDNGTVAGQIQVAYAGNPMNLVKEGNGLFHVPAGSNPLPSAAGNARISYQLKQGFLERSNVDTEKTMVELMGAFRNLQANQQVLKAYDHTMGLAVNKVGSLT
ncbi:MAG TPA: flagellar hook-basal body protein [Bacillales bacterium]|nr:flagellar hook-basal body protein [Bacillales bacterium]